MHVAILGPFNVIGGVSTVVEEIASVFCHRGDYVTVVTVEQPEKTFLQHEKLDIFAPDAKSNLPVFKQILKLADIIKFLRQTHYDIVISNLYYSSLLGIVQANKKIHIMHGMGCYSPKIKDSFRAKVGNYSNILGNKLADTTIANSYLTASVNNIMFEIKSTVVPLGVSQPEKNISSFCENKRDIDLLYIGRLVSAKMLPIVLEALALLLKNNNQPINFHIVGNGPEENNLKALAKDLGLENKVIFHGYIPREKINQFYTKARCLISLNPTEPFGLTYLEALVHGTPVILCRGCGFSSFCDDRFACFVDCSPKSVAEAIHRALTIEWEREWIATYILENFSWYRTVELILDAVYKTDENLI